jgi:hypothetical protein
MKPKIQHTAEEWESIVDDLRWNPDVMVELREKGYIRKSLREEAEEMWLYHSTADTRGGLIEIIRKLHDALLEQDAKIKQLEARV